MVSKFDMKKSEEGQRTYWLKYCEYNNKDEDNSINIVKWKVKLVTLVEGDLKA